MAHDLTNNAETRNYTMHTAGCAKSHSEHVQLGIEKIQLPFNSTTTLHTGKQVRADTLIAGQTAPPRPLSTWLAQATWSRAQRTNPL